MNKFFILATCLFALLGTSSCATEDTDNMPGDESLETLSLVPGDIVDTEPDNFAIIDIK